MMENEISLAVEQPLPRSGNRFEMQVEPRARAVVEEATQQRQGLRQGTYVADDDTELAFLAERELRGMIFEAAQIVQKNARTLME